LVFLSGEESSVVFGEEIVCCSEETPAKAGV
jgi:hypothetical protein